MCWNRLWSGHIWGYKSQLRHRVPHTVFFLGLGLSCGIILWLCNRSHLNLLKFEENFDFFFISVLYLYYVHCTPYVSFVNTNEWQISVAPCVFCGQQNIISSTCKSTSFRPIESFYLYGDTQRRMRLHTRMRPQFSLRSNDPQVFHMTSTSSRDPLLFLQQACGQTQ
jgi:hypothetical protein